MGQAKRRGTYEQRVAKAIALQEALLEQQNLALTKPLPTQVAVVGDSGANTVTRAMRTRTMMPALLALTSLASLGIPRK